MQQTQSDRTVTVSLYVVSETKEGWKVRSPCGGVTYLPCEFGFRLSPVGDSPARFKMPVWLWARISEGS